ncbi:hypothetical protein A2223_03410 [Candidatus Falkowbacteria bacterium RIFOXYA2_FULL_35_8]|nr:MAG: hypothetical protein A2223_03410 [Candidatus Falkowbacteria bacterium RIFOXYA2_FULL_35_8]
MKQLIQYPKERLARRYRIRYQHNRKHLYLDLAIVCSLLFLIGLNIFYWLGGFHYFFNRVNIEVKVGQEEIISGDQTAFFITYENNNKYDIHEAKLSLNFPKNFILQEISRPDYDRATNTLPIGNLAPGSNGSLIVAGKVLGEINQPQNIWVNFSFYKTNKQGTRLWGLFRKIEEKEFTITGSKLATEFSLPDKIVSQQEFVLPFSIRNNMGVELEEVKVVPRPMVGFSVFVTTDTYLENSWHYYKVIPDTEIIEQPKIKIETDKDSFELAFDVFIRIQGQYFKQSEFIVRKDVFNPELYISQTIDRLAIKAGDWVSGTIKLENKGQYSIEDNNLEIELIGDYWDTAVWQPKVGKVENNILKVNFEQLPELELLQPGEIKEFIFKFKTKTFVPGVINPELAVSTNLGFTVEGLQVFFRGDTSDLRISSNLTLRAYARYYTDEGDQLGRGPLPPTVNQPTKYWVFLQVLNDINSMDNVKLTATLPSNVSWVNNTNVPVGNAVSYNSSNRQITWSISKIKIDPKNIGVAFEVELIPFSSQLGQFATLLQNIEIFGQDSFTSENISTRVNNVTTDLTFDRIASKKGGRVK